MTVDANLLLLLKSSGIGDGEPDLGERLMVNFLRMLVDSGTSPARVICMNSAIFLTTEGTPVLDQLRAFEAAGGEILSCGTCLEYYKRTDKVVIGRISNMKETVAALLSFAKVIAP
jgi:selenium metabolism protein YedF